MERYPGYICVGKSKIKVNTDFRYAIKALTVECSSTIGILEQVSIVTGINLHGRLRWWKFRYKKFLKIAINNPEELAEAFIDYMCCGRGRKKTSQNKIIDYDIDYPLIYSAFLHDYGIDLNKEKMHWWRFCDLFNGLHQDNQICQAIMYRSADLSKVKDKEQRKHIAEMKKVYAIEQEDNRMTLLEMQEYIKSLGK